MSCWAAVYTMMKSWRNKKELSVNSVIAELGVPWDDYYLKEMGLPGGKENDFVNAMGMSSQPPANYDVNAYINMLRTYGPLWIITGDGLSAHARLFFGVYGNPEEKQKD